METVENLIHQVADTDFDYGQFVENKKHVSHEIAHSQNLTSTRFITVYHCFHSGGCDCKRNNDKRKTIKI
jgi:hypothetical protein